MPDYYGKNGTPYTLGKEIGRGGEGTVFAVRGHPDLAAKIYQDCKFNNTSREHLRQKILTMIAMPISPYRPVIRGGVVAGQILTIAWPLDILTDVGGRFVGYVMPNIDPEYKPLICAHVPQERSILFGGHYKWTDSIVVAINLCSVVADLHERGIVLGDLNPNNIFVNGSGNIVLLDADSFNISDQFRCTVGVNEVLPPELQGENLADPQVSFTEKTDDFGVAIHVFQLLMNSVHPFGCAQVTSGSSSYTITQMQQQIVGGVCPYVSNTKLPYKAQEAPDILILPDSLRALIDQAFTYTATNCFLPAVINARPTARQWYNELIKLYSTAMNTCGADPSHVYPAYCRACPWCEIEAKQAHTAYVTPTAPAAPAGFAYQQKRKLGKRIRPAVFQAAPTLPSLRRPAPFYAICAALGGLLSLLFKGVLLRWTIELFDKIEEGALLSPGIDAAFLVFFGMVYGFMIAWMLSELYQTSKRGWPWYAASLLAPACASLTIFLFGLLGILCLVLVVVVIIVAMELMIGGRSRR